MTIRYRIHEGLRLVVTQYLNTVTDDTFVSSYEHLLNDPAMQPGFSELVDLSEAENLKITSAGMQKAGRLIETFLRGQSEGMRTAVFAPFDRGFGLARMYEMLNDRSTESVMVFRDLDEAMRWLGKDPVPLSGLHGEDES